MASYQLALLSIRLCKMVPLEKISSSPTTKKFNVSCSIQGKESSDVSSHSQTLLRRSANYQPSIWHDDYIQSLSSKYTEELYIKQSELLKEEVRVIVCQVENQVDQLEMIDTLQRLGVAYHFNNEIRNILENIYNNIGTLKKEMNLYSTALAFRLLRQHGYNISSDVFVSFQDEKGNFKKCISVDVEGLLSLYEASFLSAEDEPILDEAQNFTAKFLTEFVNKYRDNDTSLLINHALEFPLHWRVPKWDSLWFINVYKRRKNVSHALLQFSILDFNIVQSIHQEELKCASRWWKTVGVVEKLSFARDRLVECFVWSVGMNFRREFEIFRSTIVKVTSLITVIDDIYDVYGTLEELELFTKAINSWDPNAIDNLPHYMKICFLALYNLVNEIAFVSLKENGHHIIIPYLKKAWVDLCKSFFIEAKWYHSGYMPNLQEYLENAWISISAPAILIHALFSIPNPLKREDLVCFEEYPNIIRLSATIFRLADDLGSCEREKEAGDVSKSIQCYMNETGASEADAREHIKCMICTTWKKMNAEAHNSSFSKNFIDIAVNLARGSLSFYQYGDGFTVQDLETKSLILSSIFQPIPLKSIEKYIVEKE